MKFPQKQGGFSLISVMLMLAGMAAVATYQFREQAMQFQLQKGHNSGLQMRMVNDGIEGYLVAHGGPLRSMADNDCSGRAGCAPAAWYCAPIGTTGDQCELNLARLSAEGYLPPNWQNINPWGSPYKTVVTRVLKPNAVATGNEMDYNLRAITVTQAPWVDGDGRPMLGLVGQAVRAGGADLAMTSADPLLAEGLARRTYNADMDGGTIVNWTADNSMNPWINGTGLLVARAGFESMGNNAFPELMRRDGSGMMRGNLNLAGNRVNNAQDAYVKQISGGRNLAALSPTWVFKYSWRVGSDGAQIQKPDCSAQSGGWTNRTTLNNPWDPRFAPGSSANRSYDRGEPRILVVNDYLANMKSLGYYDSGATCADGIAPGDPSNGSSCPANDPYAAYDPAFRTRAKASYSFYATDGGAFWNVFMRYYQDNTHNAASNPANSSGIASVYCYYDHEQASGCNGEQGCAQSGQSRAAGSAAAPNTTVMMPASTGTPFQSPLSSGTPSQVPPGTGAPGARDVETVF